MGEWTLPVVAVGLVVVGLLAKSRLAAGTSLILLINWALCDGVVHLTNDDYPVLFFMVADYGCAIAILLIRQSHWQSAIMGVYACQLVCHAAYALSNMGVAPTYYSYWALTYMGWLQLALIGGWIATDLIGPWLPVFGGGRSEARDDAMAREKSR